MLSQLSIGKRLALAFGAVLLLLLSVGVAGLYGVDQVGQRLRAIYDHNLLPTKALAEMQRLSEQNRVWTLDMILSPGSENVAARSAQQDKNSAAIEKAW